MEFRNFRRDDEEKIRELFANNPHYSSLYLPSIDDSMGAGVVESGKEIVAFGMIKLFCELITVTNYEMSPTLRTRALVILNDAAKDKAKKFNVEMIYALTQDKRFEEFLTDYLHFKKMPSTLLYERVNGKP